MPQPGHPRADVVGSLLRPAGLLEARAAHAAGDLPAAEFKRVEDRAVDAALRLQEEAGLDVVTDGELRRVSFQSQMVEAVDGFGQWDLDAFLWGRWRGDGLDTVDVPRPELAVVGRLERKRFLCAEEFIYVRGRTDRQVKVTLPSPSLFANFWEPDRAPDAYGGVQDMLADVTRILREEVAELARLGCTCIQLDAPHYTMLADPAWRRFYTDRGIPASAWIARGLELDNAVAAAAPEGMTVALHVCRGNQMSRWLVEGGYGAIADEIFPHAAVDRFMLEYDDARSGGFEPLRSVPDGTDVVLGLVTTKTPQLEDEEALLRRIDEAAALVPLERLALSTQCGFATSLHGNALTMRQQRAKLELVARVARKVWG